MSVANSGATERIERAAVLGAGVMGAAIAAHLANVGIPTLLLDIPAHDGPDRERIGILTITSRTPGEILHDPSNILNLNAKQTC